jgi:hypothetical protein
VFCSNTARASIVRLEITACASCINNQTLCTLFNHTLMTMLKTTTKVTLLCLFSVVTHVFQEVIVPSLVMHMTVLSHCTSSKAVYKRNM